MSEVTIKISPAAYEAEARRLGAMGEYAAAGMLLQAADVMRKLAPKPPEEPAVPTEVPPPV